MGASCIKVGIETLLEQNLPLLKERKVGLVSHSAAVLEDFTSTREALLAAGIKLTALFSPEHGFFAAAADGTPVEDTVDGVTGVPIHSLYGNFREPTPEMLENVDVVLIDLQDVGARFYTYLSTLYFVLKACAQAGKSVWVMDRPNPIRGDIIEGPILQEGFESFIGVLSIPIRHGMTMGELARYIVNKKRFSVDLRVIPMQGWRRKMWFDETGRHWVPTSPAMPHFETAIPYPGTCLLEGTNLSEGRGTGLPFEILGAPWLDGYKLAKSLHNLELPGVAFRPHEFIPSDGKHKNCVCHGVQVHVTNRDLFRPVLTGIKLLAKCIEMSPEDFQFLPTSWEGIHPHLDLLTGSAKVRVCLMNNLSIEEMVNDWSEEYGSFCEDVQPFLLYSSI